jgi:hypothetical protein
VAFPFVAFLSEATTATVLLLLGITSEEVHHLHHHHLVISIKDAPSGVIALFDSMQVFIFGNWW